MGGEAIVMDVAIAIIKREGRYLITRRRGDVPLPGLWEFPGGKRLPNETVEQCLIREVREELNVSVMIKQFYQKITYNYPDRTITLHAYRCTLLDGTPTSTQEIKWVLPQELFSYPFPKANEPLLNALAEENRSR